MADLSIAIPQHYGPSGQAERLIGPLRLQQHATEGLCDRDKWRGEQGLKAAHTAASLANLGVNAVRQAAGRDIAAAATLRRELGYQRVERADPRGRAPPHPRRAHVRPPGPAAGHTMGLTLGSPRPGLLFPEDQSAWLAVRGTAPRLLVALDATTPTQITSLIRPLEFLGRYVGAAVLVPRQLDRAWLATGCVIVGRHRASLKIPTKLRRERRVRSA